VQPFTLTHSRCSPPTAVCCYANAKVHVKTDKDAESRIPSFNPTSDLFLKPRLNRDVCMIHQSIRKPKCELISIDQPGYFDQTTSSSARIPTTFILEQGFRTRLLQAQATYEKDTNPSSANMAPNTNIDLYTAGSTSMP
jgi:hypothetical protein